MKFYTLVAVMITVLVCILLGLNIYISSFLVLLAIFSTFAYAYINNPKDIPEIVGVNDIDFSDLLDDCFNFNLPSYTILTDNNVKLTPQHIIEKKAKTIVNFYADRKIKIEFLDAATGIRLDVLKFRDIEKDDGKPVQANDLTKYVVDLARALKLGEEQLTFKTTIPGESAFSITIPTNTTNNNIRIKNIFESPEFIKFITDRQIRVQGDCFLNAVPIVLGADTQGFVYFDMLKSPHILVAGTTGSGKSVCINTILTSLLMLHTTDTLELYLSDLKDGVELIDYQDLPHVKGFYDSVEDTVDALAKFETMMTDRNKIIRAAGKKNIGDYNASIRTTEKIMPFIIFVIDEFIALSDNDAAIDTLLQLSAKARSAGIFLILSTQRPSKQVINTTVKENLTNRIAFRTTDEVSSRIILDDGAAAQLMGGGDGIIKSPLISTRFQGCYVDEAETNRITKYWKKA